MKHKVIVFIGVFIFFSSLVIAQENAIANAMNNNKRISLVNKEQVKKVRKIKLSQGWSTGLNFGITKFKGDISQYDHYPAYQDAVNFFELKRAISFNLEKKISSLYSLATEVTIGEFAGLRRPNEYLGYTVYEPWNNRYEGNGDKIVASFSEIDLLVNVNLTNAMSCFVQSKMDGKIHFNGKLGMGYNIFNSLRTNLVTGTYVHDFGFVMEDGIDLGTQKKPFLDQATETVYVYGIRADYEVNSRMKLNIDYTIRNGLTDKWDASIMATQYTTDNFGFLSVGVSYDIGNHDFNNDWTSPINILKDDISMLNIRIEGFTDDSDNDGVADAFDKNPNTLLGVAVDGAGNALDVDMDNVPDYRDADPFSNRGALVDVNGIELDDDKDGVPNSKDLESNTPAGIMVNQFGMTVNSMSAFSNGTIVYLPSVYFNSGSQLVDDSNENRIATIALLLRNNQHIKLNVIGHTDHVGDPKFNKELGLKRANAVINHLVLNYNIEPTRFIAKTKGAEDPLSTINIIHAEEGKDVVDSLAEINRRVDFEIAD